jgi:hypothetical protein
MKLSTVVLLLLFLAKPQDTVCYGFLFIVTINEIISQYNLCTAHDIKWRPVYVFSAHDLCSGFLSTSVLNFHSSHICCSG